MRGTAVWRRAFTNAYRDKPRRSPMRRWVHLEFLGAGVFGVGACVAGSYAWAAAFPPESGTSASFAIETFMTHCVPQAAAARAWGALASLDVIPPPAHHAAIRALVTLFGVDTSRDVAPVEAYPTVQDYFSRYVRIDPPDAGAFVVSPADAVVTASGEVAPAGASGGKEVVCQVKGETVSLDALFRFTLPPLVHPKAGGADAATAATARYYVTLALPTGGYHHFHSPCRQRVLATMTVPGDLLPTTATALRWLPRVVVSNERVLILGERVDGSAADPPPAAPGPKPPSAPPPGAADSAAAGSTAAHGRCVAMAAIGGYARGRIRLSFDERVETNLTQEERNFVNTSVARKYTGCSPVAQPLDELGRFDYGSAIVLVFDGPAGLRPLPPGATVRVGQSLTVGGDGTGGDVASA